VCVSACVCYVMCVYVWVLWDFNYRCVYFVGFSKYAWEYIWFL